MSPLLQVSSPSPCQEHSAAGLTEGRSSEEDGPRLPHCGGFWLPAHSPGLRPTPLPQRNRPRGSAPGFSVLIASGETPPTSAYVTWSPPPGPPWDLVGSWTHSRSVPSQCQCEAQMQDPLCKNKTHLPRQECWYGKGSHQVAGARGQGQGRGDLDLAPGSPPHAGVSGTATREVLRPSGSCLWGIQVPGCGQPWAPTPQRGSWTPGSKGTVYGVSEASSGKQKRTLRIPSHAQVLPPLPWASSRT